jgi:hypothetical protein
MGYCGPLLQGIIEGRYCGTLLRGIIEGCQLSLWSVIAGRYCWALLWGIIAGHSGSTGCHNYFLILIFFALYVSSHLGRMVYNQKSGFGTKMGIICPW